MKFLKCQEIAQWLKNLPYKCDPQYCPYVLITDLAALWSGICTTSNFLTHHNQLYASSLIEGKDCMYQGLVSICVSQQPSKYHNQNLHESH